MDLEQILIQAASGFVLGFAHGVFIDRHMGFLIEMGKITRQVYSNSEKGRKAFNTLPKLYENRFSREILGSIAASGFVALVNSYLDSKISNSGWAMLIAAIPAFIGTKLGELSSKALRNRAKISEEEQNTYESYLDRIKTHIIKGEKIGEVKSEVEDFIVKLCEKKKSSGLYKKLATQLRDAAFYATNYNKVSEFLDGDDDSIEIDIRKHRNAYALVLVEDMIHSTEMMPEEPKSFEIGLLAPAIGIHVHTDSPKAVQWDNTVDGLLKVAQKYYLRNGLVIVKGTPGADVESNILKAVKIYTMPRVFELQDRETVKSPWIM